MKTQLGTLGGTITLAALALFACTPEASPESASVPQGSFKSAVCGGTGAEVLLLVDTSARMADPSGFKKGSKYLSRYDLVVDALKRTLPHVKKVVDFGMILFPGAGLDAQGGNSGAAVCPASCDVSDVLGGGSMVAEPGNPYGWMVSSLETVEIGGKAAVAEALLKARDWYVAHPANGRSRAVVLFTAGGEECSGEILSAIDALKAIGVDTEVISFDNAPDQELLATMASRGGRQSGSDPATLRFLNPNSGIDLLESAMATGDLVEICDGLDNDCDGLTDEGFDADGDGWSTCTGDCNDNDAFAYPGASEGGRLAPYAAARVTSFFQGTTKGGAAVDAASSNPAEALDSSGDHFSLGFDGYVELEFDCPIKNGPGNDLRIFEKTGITNVAYVTETADVFAFDAVNKAWVKLGQASNLPILSRPNVANDFDLGDLQFAHRIRIMNTTATAGAESLNDGFDVNGVYSMHDCGDCDGQDNDCDGETDEGYNLGALCVETVGQSCQVSGALACDPSGIKAICAAPALQVTAEACDGQDNDCDGQVDESLSQECQTGCGTGHRTCIAGAWGDCAIDKPNIELCNGLDDDCDGSADEGFEVGVACSAGKNACAVTGMMVCSADGLEAVCEFEGGAVTTGGAEICNGLDDDCDGLIDNGKGLCPNGQVCFKGQCVYD